MVGTADRPEWVAADVGRVLGLARARTTLATFDADEKGLTSCDTLRAHSTGASGVARDHLTVTEAGLYRLIFLSRKPEAKTFRRWVMHEVLPSIRKHGCYPPPAASSVPALPLKRPAGRPRNALPGPMPSTGRLTSLAPTGPTMCSIDLLAEPLASLSQARGHPLLKMSSGRQPSFCTVLRYVQVGIKGIRLEAVTTPPGLFTTELAIVRFIERLSLGATSQSTRPPTPAQRQAAIQWAQSVLATAGM